MFLFHETEMIRKNQRRLSNTISSIVLNVDRNPPSIIHKIYQDAKYLSLSLSVISSVQSGSQGHTENSAVVTRRQRGRERVKSASGDQVHSDAWKQFYNCFFTIYTTILCSVCRKQIQRCTHDTYKVIASYLRKKYI